MAYVYFDSKYAPCGFLIVPHGGDPYDARTTLAQTDWDYPAIAMRMGWEEPEGKPVSVVIASAYDWIEAHEGENFDALNDMLPHTEGETP